MNPVAPGRPDPAIQFGLPADDPLAARIFPALPGEVKWGLGRTERLLAALQDPHRTYPVLHVAGTNGKGSVARIWSGILRAAGFRTGLYTSPHLISFRERILVDRRPIPDELLEEWARDLRPLLLRECPSFFEAATVLAFLAFARAEVDVAVVEVGMGGRLDATNVVSPVLTAVTNVAEDHTGILGDTVAKIAREKAGILKPGVPAFTASDDPIVLEILRSEAAAREALLSRIAQPSGRSGLEGSRFRMNTRRWGPLELASPLVGRHQLRNLALAIRSLEALPPRLPVSGAAVREGVLRTRVAGRFQVEREGMRTWILDAAHNPAGVRALVRTLEEVRPAGPLIGVVGILRDKPWREMLTDLDGILDEVVLTVPGTAPRARRWDPHEAAAAVPRGKAQVVANASGAIEVARERAGPSGTVIVAGSAYTVGEALQHLGRIPTEALPVPFESG